MVYRVAPIPSEIYKRLLILDPPPKEKHVAFTDLNEIRTFRNTDPPISVSSRGEIELLLDHIRRLERKLDRFTKEKEQNQMPVVLPARYPEPRSCETSAPSTPRSVNSPQQPLRTFTPESAVKNTMPVTPPPQNAQKALTTAPTKTNLPQRPQVSRQVPLPEPQPSILKRFVLGLGALCITGIAPAFISVVFLGPAGLGIVAGLALLGWALMATGNNMK